jgi:hypothetical protein
MIRATTVFLVALTPARVLLIGYISLAFWAGPSRVIAGRLFPFLYNDSGGGITALCKLPRISRIANRELHRMAGTAAESRGKNAHNPVIDDFLPQQLGYSAAYLRRRNRLARHSGPVRFLPHEKADEKADDTGGGSALRPWFVEGRA